MRATFLVTAVLACLALQARAGETEAPLVLERTIPLADVSGRIDHMAVDPRRGRLFVAELGNDTVDVVDLADGHVIHRIGGLREPQGVGYSPAADVIAVANAGDGSVRLYKGEDFARCWPGRPSATTRTTSGSIRVRANSSLAMGVAASRPWTQPRAPS